ncbi:histone-like transcription factor (CBF/NF-Y) and archaeal histone domain-containing protein [Sarocladium implicatum]|nr:histone-like transcription factor (CBF/NF-Y) and archaeal histone domain-containing protein [Sarocladium implicatum]
MPYNTSAIPPRKDPTGTTQLPLSRVKKVIAQDSDIHMCSNNAAFVITLATEMFIQRLAEESHNQAKLERKPRRNVQYKDVASAVSSNDHLEFLEDMVPKTTPFKKIKASAFATQARLRGEQPLEDARPSTAKSNGDAGATTSSKMIVNGTAAANGAFSVPPRVEPDVSRVSIGAMVADDDPSEQLAMEMRQATGRDGDVDMSG